MDTTNFAYLEEDWPELFSLARETEKSLTARSVVFKCRLLLEVGLEWLFENEPHLELSHYRMSLDDMIKDRGLTKVIPSWQIRELDLVRREGNLAAHKPKPISWKRAHDTLKHTHCFLAWLDANYGEEPDEDRKLREQYFPPQQIEEASEREAILEEKLAQAEAEIGRLRRENERLTGRLKDKKAQLAAMQMKQDLAAARRKRNTERGRNDEAKLPHPFSDAETRKQLAAVRLREAGWDPEDPHCTNEAPDFVLRNKAGVPIAVLETFSGDARQAAQSLAQEHAEELASKYGEKPEAYFTDGLHLWRCQGANKPPVAVEEIPEQEN